MGDCAPTDRHDCRGISLWNDRYSFAFSLVCVGCGNDLDGCSGLAVLILVNIGSGCMRCTGLSITFCSRAAQVCKWFPTVLGSWTIAAMAGIKFCWLQNSRGRRMTQNHRRLVG